MGSLSFDPIADHYDATRGGERRGRYVADVLAPWLPDAGVVCEIGVGTALVASAVADGGTAVVGVDISAAMLALAAPRLPGRLARADASALPFADSSFDAVVSVLTHTDLDHPEAAFAEAARVLRRGGRLSYVGTHPCFVTPFVERRSAGAHLLHPGYRQRGWHQAGPGFGQGIRPRVGVHHLPLAD